MKSRNGHEKLKEERYKEARNRIESAISSGYYFEAIAICESILNDRVCSFLKSINALDKSTVDNLSFYQLIILWKVAVNNPGSIWERCDNLISRVDNWRKDRNKYIHGLVKFPNKKMEIVTTKEFIQGAQQTASTGQELSLLVSDWRDRQIAIKTRAGKKTEHNK